MEREISRLGLTPFDFAPKTGIVEADNELSRRIGSVAERGPLVAPAYDVFGLTGLIALKIGLFALIVGTAALLIRVGRPILVSLAVALLAAGAAAGVLGAATNLHAVGLV